MTQIPDPQPRDPASVDAEIEHHVRLACQSAAARKGEELRVLAVGEVAAFTDYFVVCAGSNPRQVQAIADGIEETLRPLKVRPHHVEGLRAAHWVLMDYGDFVVHVFLDEKRKFYGLERLWSDAEDVTERFVESG